MIILDTNVVSGLMRYESPAVEWLDRQPRESICTTAMTVFEIWLGFHLLYAGTRRSRLEREFSRVLSLLGHRILPFDAAAAEATAELQARRSRSGRSVDLQDAQIAGIAVARRAQVATRNVRHFEDAGVPVLNPWT